MDIPSVDFLRAVITDVVVCGSIGSVVYYLRVFIKPFTRGFFCDDETIRYPHLKSTVPALPLQVGGMLIPIFLIFIGEYLRYRRSKKTSSSYRFERYKIKAFYWSLYRKLVCFLSGVTYVLLLTEVGKKAIGRLRPNFIHVCGMDMKTVCSNITHEYITNYTCVGEDSEVEESRVSFPSGHSSFSFYVAVFIVLYLEKVLKMRIFLLKPAIQFLSIVSAWYISLSRVMDNKHHWSDVLSGIVIGGAVAIINTVVVYSMFEDEKLSAASSAKGNQTNDVSHEAQDQV